MRSKSSYGSYEQFKSEILKPRTTMFTASVDDMADEMYHPEIQDEFDSLWDKAASDD